MNLAANGDTGGTVQTLVFFALIFGLFYLLLIRPQSKRRKEAERMQKEIGAGAKVITVGGLYGTIVGTDDDSVQLEIAPGVTARYARQAVARVLEQPSQPETTDSSGSGDVIEPSDN